jgi:hypothetical protein
MLMAVWQRHVEVRLTCAALIAGDMPGMRMGAERIVRCVTAIFNGYGLPEIAPWAAAAARLGGRRGRVDAGGWEESGVPPLPLADKAVQHVNADSSVMQTCRVMASA